MHTAHPATELFPMMDESSLKELADDIKEHGLIEPIVTYGGQILDGRNRLRACEMAGVKARFVEWQPDGMSPTEWVISVNLKRRHLTVGQRAAIAVEMLPLLEAEARERKTAIGTSNMKYTDKSVPIETNLGRSREHAAAIVGVGAQSVARAKLVKRDAPELFEEVIAGTKTLNRAIWESGHEPSAKWDDRKARQEGDRTFIVKTERDRMRAESHRRRLNESIGYISGATKALTQANFQAAKAAANEEEVAGWLQQLRESMSNLRKVEAGLRP